MRINNLKLQQVLKEYSDNAYIVDIIVETPYLILIIEYEEWYEIGADKDFVTDVTKIEHLIVKRVTQKIKEF